MAASEPGFRGIRWTHFVPIYPPSGRRGMQLGSGMRLSANNLLRSRGMNPLSDLEGQSHHRRDNLHTNLGTSPTRCRTCRKGRKHSVNKFPQAYRMEGEFLRDCVAWLSFHGASGHFPAAAPRMTSPTLGIACRGDIRQSLGDARPATVSFDAKATR